VAEAPDEQHVEPGDAVAVVVEAREVDPRGAANQQHQRDRADPFVGAERERRDEHEHQIHREEPQRAEDQHERPVGPRDVGIHEREHDLQHGDHRKAREKNGITWSNHVTTQRPRVVPIGFEVCGPSAAHVTSLHLIQCHNTTTSRLAPRR